MPLAWPILGEKLRGTVALALALCIGGLGVLIWPVLGSAGAIGLALSVAAAMSLGGGDDLSQADQDSGRPDRDHGLADRHCCALMLVCHLIFQGWPTFELAPAKALVATVVNGLIGSAFCYFLWYHVVGRLPATTASLGSLLSPAIGVLLSALMLGEIPSTIDVIGFGLIFAAAMSVILRRPANAPAAKASTK